MSCLCGYNRFKTLEFDLPVFEHYKYSTILNKLNLKLCLSCCLILNNLNRKIIQKNQQQFGSVDYASSGQTKKKVIYQNGNNLCRADIQSKIIVDLLKIRNPVILDVGCFDGLLLKKIKTILPESKLNGLEYSQIFQDKFECSEFQYIDSLDKIPLSVDAVIFSHSIMYIPNLIPLLSNIKNKLKKDGFILVQIPDIIKNPANLLLGDQLYYLTRKSLFNISTIYGFQLQLLADNHFENEIIAILFHMNFKKNKDCIEFKEKSLLQLIDYLVQSKTKISNINYDELVIFGSNINSALIDEILGERALYFVDEFTLNKNNILRNKKIFHPSKFQNNFPIVLFYGERNNFIRKKLEEKYNVERRHICCI